MCRTNLRAVADKDYSVCMKAQCEFKLQVSLGRQNIYI